MARKTETITIAAPGRDQGKVYVLTEFGAFKTERWCTRALLAMTRAGADVPSLASLKGEDGAVIAAALLRAVGGLKYEEAEPLLDEMLTAAQFVPNPDKPMVLRPVDGTNTEEVATYVQLRIEIAKLHLPGLGLGTAA